MEVHAVGDQVMPGITAPADVECTIVVYIHVVDYRNIVVQRGRAGAAVAKWQSSAQPVEIGIVHKFTRKLSNPLSL